MSQFALPQTQSSPRARKPPSKNIRSSRVIPLGQPKNTLVSDKQTIPRNATYTEILPQSKVQQENEVDQKDQQNEADQKDQQNEVDRKNQHNEVDRKTQTNEADQKDRVTSLALLPPVTSLPISMSTSAKYIPLITPSEYMALQSQVINSSQLPNEIKNLVKSSAQLNIRFASNLSRQPIPIPDDFNLYVLTLNDQSQLITLAAP